MTGGPAAATPGLSASFERLSLHADEWGAHRVLDEGLDLVRDASWADECRLFTIDDDRALEVASRPSHQDAQDCLAPVPLSWFPWGLAPVNPRRFVLVSDAAALPSSPHGARLGDLGIVSCLHLPILERQRAVGALHLYWHQTRLDWDDERGRLLRLLGRFLLGRFLASEDDRPDPDVAQR
jgi:GAF domain-containing protein